MSPLKEGSAVYKAINKPPEVVVKWLPPSLLTAGMLLFLGFGVFKFGGQLFSDSDAFMSAVISLGLFFGGMWVILSKGYPPSSNKYAIGAILLVCFNYLSDAVEPALSALRGIIGGG